MAVYTIGMTEVRRERENKMCIRMRWNKIGTKTKQEHEGALILLRK